MRIGGCTHAEVLLAVQCAVQCSVCAGSNSVLVIDLHVCIRFIIIGRLVGRNVNSQRVSCRVLAGGMDGEKGVI